MCFITIVVRRVIVFICINPELLFKKPEILNFANIMIPILVKCTVPKIDNEAVYMVYKTKDATPSHFVCVLNL